MSEINADQISEPNFTQIPNVVFDYWMHELDHCTTIVLMYLCRKTFGWHKLRDCLSLKKIEDGTKMSRPRVIKSLNILEDHGLIKKEMHKNDLGDQDPNTYEIMVHKVVVNDDYHVVNDINHQGSKQNLLGVVNDVYPQKKDLQNKNNRNILAKPYGSHVKFSDEEYKIHCSKWGKDRIDELIEAINDHCTNNRPKGYDDYSAALRTFMRKQNQTQGKNHANSTGNKNNRKLNDGKSPEKRGYFINGKPIV